MAFPGRLNINYYKGDTYEFKIYPKNSDGSVFNLAPYVTLAGYGGTKFTIAESRGSAGLSTQIEAFAKISDDETHILCVIPPAVGLQLNPSKSYVYDVQITRNMVDPEHQLPVIYTLLDGNITVTDHITGALS